MTVEPVRSAAAKGWDGAGAPVGASQGQSPARGAPDPAPRSGALDDWLTRIRHSVKPSMWQNWRNYADYYVIPHIGQRKAQEIDGAVLDALYARLLAEGRRKADKNSLMHDYWLTNPDAKAADLVRSCGVTIYAARAALPRFRRGQGPGARAGAQDRRQRSSHPASRLGGL
jgi:hypothetical protein